MTNAQTYNFDEVNTEDTPQIIMSGHKYRLVYPTVEDIEKIQELKTDEERTNAMYGFLKPEGDSPVFAEVIKKQDIRVLKKFADMMKKEFGVEG